MKRVELALFRFKLGLNQKEMSDKLGITRQHYSRLERGLNNPSRKLMETFETVFPETDVWKLFEKEKTN